MHIEVSAKQLMFPKQCACCTGNADGELEDSSTKSTGVRVVRKQARSWSFPYCQDCLRHVKAWDDAGGYSFFAFFLCAVVGFLLFMFLPIHGGGIFLLIGLVLGIPSALIALLIQHKRADRMCQSSCVCTEKAASYRGWSGTVHHFFFVSEKYGIQFILSNREKVVNLSPEIEELLARIQKEERKQQETQNLREQIKRKEETKRFEQNQEISSKPVITVSTPQDALLDWINRIEGLNGPVARRTALHMGLQALPTQELKDQLIREALKIEQAASGGSAKEIWTALMSETLEMEMPAALAKEESQDLPTVRRQVL